MATPKHYGRKPPFEIHLTPEQIKRAEDKLARAQNDAPHKVVHQGDAETIKSADSTDSSADEPLTGKQSDTLQDQGPAQQ